MLRFNLFNVSGFLVTFAIVNTLAYNKTPQYGQHQQQSVSQNWYQQNQEQQRQKDYQRNQHEYQKQQQPQKALKVFTVGIMVFDDVEVLDLAGPFEVFALAGEIHKRFKVLSFGHKKNIRAQNGFNVVVDHVIGDKHAPRLDILVVPGSSSNSTYAAMNHPVFIPWIKRVAPTAEYIISVCTGVNFLCKAGLTNGLDITTHHQLFNMAEKECPRSKIYKDRRFTDNGRLFTSAGISAGIDVSLYFVKKVLGRKEANQVAFRMEYDWKDYDYDKNRGVLVNGVKQGPYTLPGINAVVQTKG